jgi:hypothetical protein
MIPTLPQSNHGYIFASDPESLTDYGSAFRAFSYFFNIILGEFGEMTIFPSRHESEARRVAGVLFRSHIFKVFWPIVVSFYSVAMINVVSMWAWASECRHNYPVDLEIFVPLWIYEVDNAVSVAIDMWLENASDVSVYSGVRAANSTVVGYFVPAFKADDWFPNFWGRIGRHLRSFIAMVLGECAVSSSGSPFYCSTAQ